jgi:hypothetical protein
MLLITSLLLFLSGGGRHNAGYGPAIRRLQKQKTLKLPEKKLEGILQISPSSTLSCEEVTNEDEKMRLLAFLPPGDLPAFSGSGTLGPEVSRTGGTGLQRRDRVRISRTSVLFPPNRNFKELFGK